MKRFFKNRAVAPLNEITASDVTGASSRMLIAGVQMQVPVMGNNIAAMSGQIERAMLLFPGLEMLLFSELAQRGPIIAYAAEDPAADERIFCQLAAKHGIWLIPGTAFVRRGKEVFNHAIVIDPQGNIVGRYDKQFPFLPFESGVSGGTDFLIFDVPKRGRFGLSICYDIWFPETTRTLTSMGVEVLLHPVLTGTTDRKAEMAIAQATAAMFQCYVIDVNGLDGGGVGQSLVVDPSGHVIYESGQTTDMFPITIDLGLVRDVRTRGANGLGQVLKSFRDRSVKFDTYSVDHESGYLRSLGPLKPMRRNFNVSE